MREALALLDDSLDAQVRALTDAEPQVTPLGPFAVVDLIKGTAAAEAADRQRNGYYELARVAAEQDARDAELAPPPPTPKPSAPRHAVATAAAPKKARKPRQSVSEKIAPKKRTSLAEPARPKPHQPLPGTAFLPKRNLPAPRGRFTRVDPSRSTYEALLKPEAKEPLEAIVEQAPTRFHVFRALETGYSGRAGAPLSVADVEGALTRHHLFGGLQKKEREKVLTAFATAKGSAPLAAKELGIKLGELDGLVAGLKLKRETQEVRERFVREALDPGNLLARLSIFGRTRYLADLKIEKRFADALSRDVARLLDENQDAAESLPQLVELVSKKHALPSELLNRAVDRLGLTRRPPR